MITWSQIRPLLTGRVEWCDPHSGAVIETEYMSWPDRWSLFGIHSTEWWWVRRYGKMHCGCTRNPLTRRMVLFRMDCPDHGRPDWFAALLEGDEDDED